MEQLNWGTKQKTEELKTKEKPKNWQLAKENSSVKQYLILFVPFKQLE